MSNEELPLSAELASAYLDGELDATGRAAASADPAVMAEVESFARVRAALGEIDPVVASTKTAAIAAALAEFDAIHATLPSPVAPEGAGGAAATNVVSMQSRRIRAYRVLSRVAAVVVVGAVVVTALNASRGDDNNDSATSATEVPAATPSELPQTKAAGAIESATEATDAPAATMAAAAADSGVAADSAAAGIAVIDTVEALEEFAAGIESAPTATVSASSQPLSAEAPPQYGSPSPGGYAPATCLTSDQVVLGPILFQGAAAFAVRDTATGALQAVDAGDCHVLVEVP